jgi:hypothetical protein
MRRRRSRRRRSVDRGRDRQSREPRHRGSSWVLTRSAHAAGPSVDAVRVRQRRPRRGRRPRHGPQPCVRNPGGPASGLVSDRQVRTGHLRGTTVMDGCRESDRFRGPRKPAHKGGPGGPAEQVEGRERAKGSGAEHTRSRTQRRSLLSPALGGVRSAPAGTCTSDPRQEPGAGVPHAGSCAGGAG